jgi:hypothetical protein
MVSFLLLETGVGVSSVTTPVSLRIVGLGVDGLSELECAGSSTSESASVKGIVDVEFDSGGDPGSDSESASRGFPGQYKSSSIISNAAPGFITRVISSNSASHYITG